MKTLKGWITTTCLAALLMVSARAAYADGVIVTGLTASAPCSATQPKEKTADIGGIIAAFAGVIITNFTGVIISSATSGPVGNCSVTVTGL